MSDSKKRKSRREYMRAYQNAWLKRRREAWIRENGPCVECGSWEDLEVDHIDPAQKITNHVWSWSEERRLPELAKCQVLCSSCHLEKSKKDVSRMFSGRPNLVARKFSDEVMLDAVSAVISGIMSRRKAAEKYGMKQGAISSILYQGVRPDILDRAKEIAKWRN